MGLCLYMQRTAIHAWLQLLPISIGTLDYRLPGPRSRAMNRYIFYKIFEKFWDLTQSNDFLIIVFNNLCYSIVTCKYQNRVNL